MHRYSLEEYNGEFADRHLLHGVVRKWAAERPEETALIAALGGRTVTWAGFERATAALAAELVGLGFRKGDYVVTVLPMTVEHVLLEYACFRIGATVAPMDLRLSAVEAVRAAEILKPRGFVALGVSGPMDFRPLWKAVLTACPWIEQRFAVDSSEDVDGAQSFALLAEIARRAMESDVAYTSALERIAAAEAAVTEDDGALVIFTTGSTGSPKPALLSHKSITVQNMCLCGAFFGGDRGARTLVNLPPSHVGGQTEALMSTLYGGGSVVLLEVFDAAHSLRVVAEHKAEILGQIPAMFQLEWMLKEYTSYDLGSIKFAAYGGNAVARPFVEQLARMSPVVGTGLGLTECAGFCTYVQADAEEHELIVAGLGVDMPVYPCTIREPMRENGLAGDELPQDEVGHVCFRGPQTFLGYVGDEEATAKAISRDGYLYTGDLGRMNGTGLHLTGRAKWVIKPLGFQVFPGDVEAHVCALSEKVATCVAVGVEHAVASEAVVAVVEKRPGAELDARELDRHARALPNYMRPRHWILLEPGKMPLNRIGKPDHTRVQQMADEAIKQLRAVGEWDAGYTRGPK
jgi:acyl-CoA synthetase (AMP-forming)/AMP-acid ligase II